MFWKIRLKIYCHKTRRAIKQLNKEIQNGKELIFMRLS